MASFLKSFDIKIYRAVRGWISEAIGDDSLNEGDSFNILRHLGDNIRIQHIQSSHVLKEPDFIALSKSEKDIVFLRTNVGAMQRVEVWKKNVLDFQAELWQLPGCIQCF